MISTKSKRNTVTRNAVTHTSDFRRRMICDDMEGQALNSSDNPQFYSRKHVAALLDVCEATISRRIAAGDLHAVKIGRPSEYPPPK